jgi:C1A family cysteine protease
MKSWQDRDDSTTLKWYDFDENTFFKAIGGTSQGAFLRAAMDRLLKVGYPVVGGTSLTASHKIKAYYSVPKAVLAVKQAIYQFGTIVLATPWFNSWSTPKGGILPAPDYSVGGHAIDAEGWDDRYGLLLVNSWGTRWNTIHKGAVFMPYAYITQCVWEIWKTIDLNPLPRGGR